MANDKEHYTFEVKGIRPEAGDTVVITLPHTVEELGWQADNILARIGDIARKAFPDEKVHILIVPKGIEVKLTRAHG